MEAPGEGNLASVLVPLVEMEDGIQVLFTRRSFSLKDHPGEICFPGGRFEPSLDRNLLDTALRETEEELGIPRDVVDVKGRLPEVSTITSNYTIYPFVAVIPPVPIRHDRKEVAGVIRVPLGYLMENGTIREGYTYKNGGFMQVFVIPYKRHIIWGATALIAKLLVERLKLEL